MSNHRAFYAVMPATSWKAAFAASLLRLMPDMNPDAADEASDQAFQRHGSLAPESAALAWVADFDKRAVSSLTAWSLAQPAPAPLMPLLA